MITEYTDCTEFLRLISDKKIKSSAVKSYLKQRGMIFTATNPTILANSIYTIFLGSKEMSEITRLIISEGNYEKSVLANAAIKVPEENKVDILEYFTDSFSALRSQKIDGYTVEQPICQNNVLSVQMSYKRNLPGKNKLIQEETRHIRMQIHKETKATASIDIRLQSSIDTNRALELLDLLVKNSDKELQILHVNLGLLTDQNKVLFFDKLSSFKFSNWNLKTVTSITVKKSTYDAEEEDEENHENDDSDDDSGKGTLAGISQAILNGSGLRSNEFVQNSIAQGYFISSMKYRYYCTQEAGEFIISISCKSQDLRVDMDKSYCDEDGKLYIQPFPKTQQDEIIQEFQKAANKVFDDLIKGQQHK